MACSIDFQALKYDYILIYFGIVSLVFNYFFFIYLFYFLLTILDIKELIHLFIFLINDFRQLTT